MFVELHLIFCLISQFYDSIATHPMIAQRMDSWSASPGLRLAGVSERRDARAAGSYGTWTSNRNTGAPATVSNRPCTRLIDASVHAELSELLRRRLASLVTFEYVLSQPVAGWLGTNLIDSTGTRRMQQSPNDLCARSTLARQKLSSPRWIGERRGA